MRVNSFSYQILCATTNPASGIKSIGLPADAQLSWFLQIHLDSFIVTGQILPIYRDSAIWTTSSWHENARPSPGTFAKITPPSASWRSNFPYHRAVSVHLYCVLHGDKRHPSTILEDM